MALLSIKGLSVSFGGIRALDGVDFEVDAREIRAVIGPNGSGKTSLFNCISGLYHPDRGRILFQGSDILGLKPHLLARQGVARTFQILKPFLNMTVSDNLLLGRHIKFRRNFFQVLLRERGEEVRQREKIEDLMDFLDLWPYRETKLSECPYGVRKNVEICRALAIEPTLVMLDEPLAGLTLEEKEVAAGRIIEIRERFRTAIILIEHDLFMASRLADRMTALDSGQKIAEGRSDEVRRHPSVERAYIGKGGDDSYS